MVVESIWFDIFRNNEIERIRDLDDETVSVLYDKYLNYMNLRMGMKLLLASRSAK